MATTRQSIIKGPGTILFQDKTFFDVSGINASIESATTDISASVSGKIDTIKTDQSAKISMTPIASFDEAVNGIFFPDYVKSPKIGQSLFGAADTPLTIHSTAGTAVKFAAAALTKCPEIYLSPVKTCFGNAEWTALLPNGATPNGSTKLYTVEQKEYTAGYPSKNYLTGLHWTGKLGDLSINDTVDGWTVTVDMATEPVTVDSVGTIDYILTGVNVSARCTPIGLSEEDILAALPVFKPRGASIAQTGVDLVLDSSNEIGAKSSYQITLRNVALVSGPLNWGSTSLRAGELMFTASVNDSGSLFNITPVLQSGSSM